MSGVGKRNGNALRKIARYSAAREKRSYQNKINSFLSSAPPALVDNEDCTSSS